jgi:hypothetical protein
MLKRLLSGVAFAALLAFSGYAFSQPPASAPRVSRPPAQTPISSTIEATDREQSAGREMQALDHHARVDMLLYGGTFGSSDRPNPKVDAVALTISAGSR